MKLPGLIEKLHRDQLVEKRQGYHYEHAFSYHWNALQGYHYLMRLAHWVQALALATKRLAQQVRAQGVQAFLRLSLRSSLAGA